LLSLGHRAALTGFAADSQSDAHVDRYTRSPSPPNPSVRYTWNLAEPPRKLTRYSDLPILEIPRCWSAPNVDAIPRGSRLHHIKETAFHSIVPSSHFIYQLSFNSSALQFLDHPIHCTINHSRRLDHLLYRYPDSLPTFTRCWSLSRVSLLLCSPWPALPAPPIWTKSLAPDPTHGRPAHTQVQTGATTLTHTTSAKLAT
jgi:hypothetical protein